MATLLTENLEIAISTATEVERLASQMRRALQDQLQLQEDTRPSDIIFDLIITSNLNVTEINLLMAALNELLLSGER